jgi:hypothetical protein
MNTYHATAVAVLLTSVAGIACAATPEQAGSYSGTVKQTTFFTGGKSVEKSTMLVEIALDDTTTVTINNIPFLTASNYYNAKDGVLVFTDPSLLPNTLAILATLNFNSKGIKGTYTGALFSPGPVFVHNLEAKFKLKKL